MRTEIRHTCGHTRTANITGPNTHGQRQRTADWLAEQPCPDCDRDRRQQQHVARNTEAATAAHQAGWPTLTGTPKQVQWATTLRADAITEMRDRLAKHLTPEVTEAVMDIWTPAALRHTDASWWIENQQWAVRDINKALTAQERAALAEATGGAR